MKESKASIFSIEIPVNDPEAMKEFNEIMAEIQDETNRHIDEEAARLGVSEKCGVGTDSWKLKQVAAFIEEADSDEVMVRDS